MLIPAIFGAALITLLVRRPRRCRRGQTSKAGQQTNTNDAEPVPAQGSSRLRCNQQSSDSPSSTSCPDASGFSPVSLATPGGSFHLSSGPSSPGFPLHGSPPSADLGDNGDPIKRQNGNVGAGPWGDEGEGNLTLLGEGGFGKVYGKGDLAMKVVSDVNPYKKAQLELEFECMSEGSKRSINVLAARELAFEDDQEGNGEVTGLLTMDRCRGSLASFWKWMFSAATLREREALSLQILHQVAGGLKAVHDAGYVHADIKLGNILVTSFPKDWSDGFATGTLKIADFGLAFKVSRGAKLRGCKGTWAYMAPEMRALALKRLPGHSGGVNLLGAGGVNVSEPNAPPGPPCDMWSLGISIWEFIFGDLPNEDDSSENRDMMTLLEDQTRTLLEELLQVDPAQRVTAADLLNHYALQFHPLLSE